MTRMKTSSRKIAAWGLAILFVAATPGCGGLFSGNRVFEAFKIGGAPGGQSEPEPVYVDTSDAKEVDSFDPFNEQ